MSLPGVTAPRKRGPHSKSQNKKRRQQRKRRRQRRFPGEPLLNAADRHLVSRFSYGVTPDLTSQVRAAGGARAWFDRQLDPSRVTDPQGDALERWWPSLGREAADLWQRQTSEVEPGWKVMEAYQSWVLARRVMSQRQLHEVMVEFWQHHLHVPASGDAAFTYRVPYDAMIRSHALGRYEDLLHDAVTHPAMGIYLNNAVSTATSPNENLGRELLELHTVGRGAYTEDDVKHSSRILTGWKVDLWRTWSAAYAPEAHWRGPVKVLGFRHENADADGRGLTRDYLRYLARHPATAQRIARRLAVKFVRDDPPQSLVDQLAKVYLAHDTEIRPVLRALVASAAFAGSVGAKVRDPAEDLVATYRALDVRLARPPQGDNDYAVTAMLWQSRSIGTSPYGWPQPNGQPIDNASWSSAARMLASLDIHYVMSGRWWPDQGITYHSDREWLPRSTIRFDRLVDHLAQQLLGKHADGRLRRACSQSVGVALGEQITPDHPMVKWEFQRLLSTVLDSPTHLTR